jgi:hypothetical protein
MFDKTLTSALVMTAITAAGASSPTDSGAKRKLFVDVHELGPGAVTAEAVAEAHQKDLEVQSRFGTRFLKYWVDEELGRVVCLAEAPDAEAVIETHRAAHGLLPDTVNAVVEGLQAEAAGDRKLFLDVHRLGPGEVTAEAVAEAHQLDLQVQDTYDVNFLDYWVDEGEGVVWCLAEAPNAEALTQTHREAHGLVPDEVMAVTQGE